MQYPIVYMVAGLSSRFGGKPKAFAKIGPNNETLIEISINRSIKAGFNKIIFIVGKETESIFKNFFKDNYKGIPIEYALQSYNPETRDKPWGTADAICSANNLINGPFLVCTGDDLYSNETYQTLFNHIQEDKTDATVGYPLEEHIPEEGEVNRGIFNVEGDYITSAEEILGISKTNYQDKNLTLETQCNIGIFLIQKETLNKINNLLENFKLQNKDNRTKECYLNVELGNLVKDNQIKLKYYPGKGKLIGITNPEDEEIARKELSSYN